MDNVELVWEVYGSDGGFIGSTSADALIQTLRPGQVSPVTLILQLPGNGDDLIYGGTFVRYVPNTYFPTTVDTQADWQLVSQSHSYDGWFIDLQGQARNVSAHTRDLKAVLSLHYFAPPRDVPVYAYSQVVVRGVAPGQVVSFSMREYSGRPQDIDHHVLTLMTAR